MFDWKGEGLGRAEKRRGRWDNDDKEGNKGNSDNDNNNNNKTIEEE